MHLCTGAEDARLERHGREGAYVTLPNDLGLGSLVAASGPRIGVGLRAGPAGRPRLDILLAYNAKQNVT